MANFSFNPFTGNFDEVGAGVTSVALSDGSTTPIYTVSGSPVTNTGTLTLTLNTQTANTVFAGPASGSAAQPTIRALVQADIPSLASLYVTQSEVGAVSGVASLDSNGKIPVSQLPSSVFIYKGTWNPSTNTPTLVDGTGTAGSTYWVSNAYSGTVAGLSNPSMTNFEIGDLVLYNGTQWELSTPAAGVTSVNGAQGTVTVNAINQLTGDATAGPASGSQSQPLTLASVNSNVGSFTYATITVNAKGLITAASNGVTPNNGTVTSVALTAPSFLSVTGSPVTTSGTLALGYSGTPLPPANGGTGVANTATLTLGSNNIVLNTTNPTNVTLPSSGTLAALGPGDIPPSSASCANNVSTPTAVAGLTFASTVKMAVIQYAVTVIATTNLYEAGQMIVCNIGNTGWQMAVTTVGNVSGVTFSINSSGQVLFTTPNYSGFVSNTISYRAQAL